MSQEQTEFLTRYLNKPATHCLNYSLDDHFCDCLMDANYIDRPPIYGMIDNFTCFNADCNNIINREQQSITNHDPHKFCPSDSPGN